jgi:hypothetical protein
MNAPVDRPGYGALWLWFGLSRASFLTMPRVMMHDMPDDWQRRMAELCFEWNAIWVNQPDLDTCVCLRKDGKFVAYPEWMLNYRHPDAAQLAHMRSVNPNG